MDILPCFSAYGLCRFEQGEVFRFLAPESYHVTLCLTFCTAFKAVHGFHTVDHEFISARLSRPFMVSLLLIMSSSFFFTHVNHGSYYL